MRIERIELDGFGRFHDVGWELGPGLTVLLGANEAGKTTLLNAVRALLFGFEPSRDGRAWYPALAGGRRGGRLVIRTGADERWVVERHGERGGGGALAVRAPNGNQGGQETLDRLLHGAGKDLFTNIFAFGLGELQTFSSLSADGVRGRIYGARAGLGGTSAVDLERRLRQSMDETFLPRGSQRPLNRLLARIEELRGEIAMLGRQPAEHAEAHLDRKRLETAAAEHRAAARAGRERLLRLRTLRDAGPVVGSLSDVQAELSAGDPTLDAVPEDGLATLDRHLAALDRARAVLSTIDDDLRESRLDLESTPVDEPILALGAEIASLLDERGRRHADEGRRLDLDAALARAEAALAEQRERTGGMAEERLLALDAAIAATDAIREHENAMDLARAARADAEARQRALADELAAGDGLATGDAIVPDLDDRLAAYRELDALRIDRASVAGRPGLSSVPVRLAVAAAAAVVGLLAGLALEAPLVGISAGIVVAMLLLVGLARVPVGAGAPWDRRWAELCARLDLPVDADAQRIVTVGDQLAAERARRELLEGHRSRADARREELQRRGRELERADEAARLAERAWCGWLRERGLDDGLSPDAARQVLAAAAAARRAVADRDAIRRQRAEIDAEATGYAGRVDALVVGLGLPAPSDAPGRDARIVGLGERLELGRAAARRRREIEARIAQLESRREPAAREAATAESTLAEFLARLGCPDPEALRSRCAEADRRRAARSRERALHERLLGLAGSAVALDALVEEARTIDPASLEAETLGVAAALEEAEQREREVTAAIGAVDASITRLESADELGDRRQELAQLEGQAAAMARGWAVRAIALRLLETTRARHERERQPDVVRAAEAHFGRITAGRYTRIVAPPGEASVRVETEGGESRSMDELSRGTGEQLYLALRFGLIEEFATQAEPLPVVMDDILVNFDADRAARAAAAIGHLAARHQVLYFTCHPWTAELLDPGGDRTVALG